MKSREIFFLVAIYNPKSILSISLMICMRFCHNKVEKTSIRLVYFGKGERREKANKTGRPLRFRK